MKEIDKFHGVDVLLYPDNQPHISVNGITEGDEVKLTWPIRNSLELVQLLMVSDALDRLFAVKKELAIPYLMAARSDRQSLSGHSVDLKVVSNLVNSCGFDKVKIFDPHSDVALQLVNRSVSIDNRELVERYCLPNSVLICPDAGASKKSVDYLKWNSNLVEVVNCVKHRNPSDGKIQLEVLEPEKCNDRDCVIVDDICDGGATFLAIADQIRPLHLALVVSHGVFSKGVRKLFAKFDQIIASDSYDYNDTLGVTIVPIDL